MTHTYIPIEESSPTKKTNLGFWRRLAKYLAFLVPLTAAFAKAFTNSYSTLSIFVFFVAGVWVVNPALFTGPLFIVICALGVATIIVSLNMEGRSLYQWLCGEKKASQDSLDTYIIEPLFRFFAYPIAKIKAYLGKWPNWLIVIGQITGLLIFTLSSLTKGFAMAPGIFNLLGLASLGIWGWVILGIAVLAVMGVSAAKEGKQLLKQLLHWQPPIRKEKPVKASMWKQAAVTILAAMFPLIAAAAKAFGYSYGFLMLLAFIYSGSFTATAAVSAWLPLIVVMGIGVSLVSLRMEGYSLFRASRRAFIADEELDDYQSKYYATKETWDKLRADARAKLDDKATAIKIELDSTSCSRWEKLGAKLLSFLFNYLIAWGAPALTFVAKSSIMMVGTISAIVLLSGGALAISWWLLLLGAVAGVTVGLVSLRKEGVKTRDTVRKYYVEIIYKTLGLAEPAKPVLVDTSRVSSKNCSPIFKFSAVSSSANKT